MRIFFIGVGVGLLVAGLVAGWFYYDLKRDLQKAAENYTRLERSQRELTREYSAITADFGNLVERNIGLAKEVSGLVARTGELEDSIGKSGDLAERSGGLLDELESLLRGLSSEGKGQGPISDYWSFGSSYPGKYRPIVAIE